MSLSSSATQRKTCIVATDDNQSTASKSVDATEDRLIHAIEFHVEGVSQVDTVNLNAQVWTGSNPFSSINYVNSGEELAVNFDYVQSGSGGRSNQLHDYQEYGGVPFQWDEHVTLTLRQNASGSDVAVNMEIVIHYTEA